MWKLFQVALVVTVDFLVVARLVSQCRSGINWEMKMEVFSRALLSSTWGGFLIRPVLWCGASTVFRILVWSLLSRHLKNVMNHRISFRISYSSAWSKSASAVATMCPNGYTVIYFIILYFPFFLYATLPYQVVQLFISYI